jgi:hypothetical protein
LYWNAVSIDSEAAHARAEAAFKKEAQLVDGQKAMAQYHSEPARTRHAHFEFD